jgi:hypothetical protein
MISNWLNLHLWRDSSFHWEIVHRDPKFLSNVFVAFEYGLLDPHWNFPLRIPNKQYKRTITKWNSFVRFWSTFFYHSNRCSFSWQYNSVFSSKTFDGFSFDLSFVYHRKWKLNSQIFSFWM